MIKMPIKTMVFMSVYVMFTQRENEGELKINNSLNHVFNFNDNQCITAVLDTGADLSLISQNDLPKDIVIV